MTTVLAVHNSEGCVGRCDANCHEAKGPHYVYILLDPRPGKNMQPFYVGKGKGRRAQAHMRRPENHCNKLMRYVLAKIMNLGLRPSVEIVHRFETEEEALQLETQLITEYGRRDLGKGSLCNLTDGGEGTNGYITGPEHAERSSKMMSERWADPEFSKASSERATAWMNKLNSDVEWAAKQAVIAGIRLSGLHKKPEYAKEHSDRWSKIMRERNIENSERNSEIMRERSRDPKYQARCLAGRSDLWSEEQVDRLKLLHSEGLTFGQIAAELGVGRGAISGKVSKLCLPRRRAVK